MNNRRKTDQMTEKGQKSLVMIAAGGSGGHIVPGLSIAHELHKKGFDVVFLGVPPKFVEFVKARGCDVISLPTPQYLKGGILGKISAVWAMGKAVLKSMLLYQKHHPSVVVGMGGFTSVAAIIAAKLSGVPAMVHEQNVLPGRANKFVAKLVDKIMLSFEKSKGFFSASVLSDKFIVTGYPLRTEVLDMMANPVPEKEADTDKINLVITGGSMGSTILSDVAYQAVCKLPKALREQLAVTHQARPADCEKVEKAYKEASVLATVHHFFDDLPERMQEGHLLVSRSGMGSVAEAAAFKLPSILIPHRLADNHQLYNAQVLSEVGGALLVEEPEYTVENMVQILEKLIADKQQLKKMSEKAFKALDYTASQKAADAILELADVDMMHQKAQMID